MCLQLHATNRIFTVLLLPECNGICIHGLRWGIPASASYSLVAAGVNVCACVTGLLLDTSFFFFRSGSQVADCITEGLVFLHPFWVIGNIILNNNVEQMHLSPNHSINTVSMSGIIDMYSEPD